MGFLPTGCPLSRASNSSLPGPLAPGESRISIACLSLTSLAVPSRLPFLLSSQARVRDRSRVIWTLLITLSAGWWPAVVQGYSSAGEQQLSWLTTLILGH